MYEQTQIDRKSIEKELKVGIWRRRREKRRLGV